MELIQVKGNTWYLDADELIPLYRLDRGGCILLDSGLLEERRDLVETLDRAGLTPVGVFGSHVHRDHSINHFYIRRRYGARVCLPWGEAALCSSPAMLRPLYDTYSPKMLMDLYGEMVGRVDDTVGPDDGVVEFCGVPFQVLHTPGHTPDHICTVTPDGVCYLADTLLTGSVLERARLPYHFDHAAARQSMEQARRMDYDAYLVAHRGVLTDPGPSVDANLALLDRCCESLRGLIVRPMTLDEVYAAYVQKEKLLTSSTQKAARYIRNLRMFLNEMTDTGALDLITRQGIRYYCQPE